MDKPKEEAAWYYRPWVVLAMLFLVLGPFGLPLLYKSPQFSRLAKILLTLVMILYTFYLVWATALSLRGIPAIIEKYRFLLS